MVGEVKWIQKMQGGRANDATEVTNATERGREQAEDGAREMIMPEKMLPPPPRRRIPCEHATGPFWQRHPMGWRGRQEGGLLNKEGERE